MRRLPDRDTLRSALGLGGGKALLRRLRRTSREHPSTPEPADASTQRASADIESLRNTKESVDALITDELSRWVKPRALRDNGDEYRRQVEALLDAAEPGHLTHPMVRCLERNDLSLRSGLSFRALMVAQSEARRAGTFRAGWLLDNKTNAYAFVDELGVRRPKTDRAVHRIGELEPVSPVVIKPVRSTGSRGTYLVFGLDSIRHLRDGTEFSSWQQMLEHARELMSPAATVNPLTDRWMVEEMILEDTAAQRPARDVKFYTFYGEILLISESRRMPDGSQEVRFWDSHGEPTFTGSERHHFFAGADGVPKHEHELVREISTEIPAPFMRIDMLRGEDGLVFGEFTPRPGNFEQLNSTWDRAFGEAWVRAEGNIIADVLGGKSFVTFAKATGTDRPRPVR
ncbi:ATP-grasp fold amidoligase family protein [Haloechinothrix sp. LS1_15]|uniref:ATP-grasp fold amidoligase family protein n=1 Tax=Haloechinothrix sp. LS1_15 TaxID=2652248 RepID=UPI00294B8272|nr:ATP-grasp fold amidoligase family protein [Haloechinothrix sp. LS1_15]